MRAKRRSTESGDVSGDTEVIREANEGVIVASGGDMETGEASGGDRETREASSGDREAGGASGDDWEASENYLSDIEDESASSSDDEDEFDEEKAQTCFDDWMVSLPSLDRKMLAVSLSQSFVQRQRMNLTEAVKETASFVGVNEKTVRKYRKEFFSNRGKFPETKRGKYTRECLLNNEDLRLEASMWVRENTYKKGATNMTALAFCECVNG